MRFYIYPPRHRKWAKIEKAVGTGSLILAAVLLLLCVWRWIAGDDITAFLLLIASFLALLFKIATISAPNALSMIEIGADGLLELDAKGEVIRKAEYRYVRGMEFRRVPITLSTGEGANRGLFETNYGVDTDLILIYLNSACCFEDLKLEALRRSYVQGKLPSDTWKYVYLSEKLFHHPNCMALVYDDAACKLLNQYIDIVEIQKRS